MNVVLENRLDPMTGLPDYAGFMDAVKRALAAAKKRRGYLAFALVDLDLFGRINEAHGRPVGDSVIRLLAARLADGLSGGALVGRYGGDALGVLFDGVEKERAFLQLEQFRTAFGGRHAVDDGAGGMIGTELSVSIGVSAYPDDGGTPALLARKANEALYRAKVGGRNKVCLAREEKMVTKTSHYTQGQLEGLSRLAKRMEVNESVLLREALDDLLRKYNS